MVKPSISFLAEFRRRTQNEVVILRKPVPDVSEAALSRFAGRAARILALHGSINVLLTDSREMRALNRRFRGKDKATDVLSFLPMPGLPAGVAGDIAISTDIAAKNAQALGHSAADEIKILVLHGLLHLAGYDHEMDNGKMARKENQVRKQLSLPTGLIHRSRHAGRSAPVWSAPAAASTRKR